VKNVGEPCAGEPHARFDAAAGGNQHQSGLCYAVGMEGDIVRSTDPAGPAASWTAATDLPEGLFSIGCASPTVCVVGSDRGTLYELEGTAWNPVRVASNIAIRAIDCPSVTLCLAIAEGGQLIVGRGPSAPPATPAVLGQAQAQIVDGVATLEGVIQQTTSAVTACRFELSTGLTVPCDAPVPVGRPSFARATVTGITQGFSFRLVVENAGGRSEREGLGVVIHGDPGPSVPAATPTPTATLTPPAQATKAPTAAEIAAAATADLAPKGAAAKLATIIKRKGYAQPTTALTSGKATVKWFATVKGKKTLIASGTQTYAAAGDKTITVKLNAKGRALLAKAKKLAIQAELTFTPAGGKAVKATRKLTLKR
jgi:hypothetical protein